MPVEDILRAYMAETQEEEVKVTEEVIERPAPEPALEPEVEPKSADIKTINGDDSTATQKQEEEDDKVKNTVDTVDLDSSQSIDNVALDISTDIPDRISFNDTDTAVDVTGVETHVDAPKTVERLEIAQEANERRKAEEAEEEEEDMPLKSEKKFNLN